MVWEKEPVLERQVSSEHFCLNSLLVCCFATAGNYLSLVNYTIDLAAQMYAVLSPTPPPKKKKRKKLVCNILLWESLICAEFCSHYTDFLSVPRQSPATIRTQDSFTALKILSGNT